MVRGLFADDLSASSTPVDRPALVHICTALGERAGRQLCGIIQRFCRSYGLPGLFCWAVANNLVRSALFARTAVFLRLVTHGGFSWTGERRGTGTGRRCSSPRNPDFWFAALCDTCAVAGSG